ncbi:osmoprotectant uptake system permease [Deinococcus aerophilus]|uniref:Osmoprotectant uptake system permease n=2 Tax=Deinococcus aerophilus TaxID=522488 RepID=A0ABQ2H0U2_9DEIO|nr:ABC transporter permease [Deinococcus aerophilus]GGM20478.1 osmoprotectant uptake system permease [Deinococcus aerophilus]
MVQPNRKGAAVTETAAPLPSPPPGHEAARSDTQAVLWLAAVPMLAAAALPWVLLRPNRLAPGDYLRLPVSLIVLVVALALLPALIARWRRAAVWLPAGAALVAAFWLLGTQTAGALDAQTSIARASAASGFWLFLLGAGTATYGAGLAGQRSGGAARWLAWLWLPAIAALFLTGQLSSWSVLIEGRNEGPRWVQELAQHLRLVGSALGLAVVIGVPLAIWASGRERVAGAVLGLANAVQTVPSLALLGLLIAPLSALATAFPRLRELGISGIGVAPALTAMTLYALLPVVRNGVVALTGVPPGAVDAARGMGMTRAQRFWRVQLPLALPVWLTGIRQAAVLLVGVAAVAALIGAGGLGTYIFKGLQSAAADLILLGAVPAALLAIGLDAALRGLERLLGRRLGRA